MKQKHPHPAKPSAAALPPPASAVSWPMLGLAARFVVGGVLLFAGLHQSASPAEEFGVVIETYHLLPETHTLLFARLIPWTEVALGAFLLFGLLTRPAAAAAAGLFAVFIFAILSTMARGIPLENCGCFGQAIHLAPWQTALLDVVLIGLAAVAHRHGGSRLSLDNWVEEGE